MTITALGLFLQHAVTNMDRYMIAMAHLSAQNETSVLLIVSEGFKAKPGGFTRISDSDLFFGLLIYASNVIVVNIILNR